MWGLNPAEKQASGVMGNAKKQCNMKNLTIFFILISLISCNKNKNDKQATKKSDTIRISNELQIIKTYYDNGNLKTIDQMTGNIRCGTSLSFYDNGILSEFNTYKDNKKNGTFIFYDKDGKIDKIGFHNNDKLEGGVTTFDKNGDTLFYRLFKNDDLVLDYLYENGKLKRIMDIKGGIYKLYDTNRNIILTKKIGKTEKE
jgi:antitoxin component YwqK of YwqJK toxin-antitoxin module